MIALRDVSGHLASKLTQLRRDTAGKASNPIRWVWSGRGDPDLIHAHVRVRLHPLDEGPSLLRRPKRAGRDRLVHAVEIPALSSTVLSQHVDLVLHQGLIRREQVARIGILRNQTKGLALPSTTDQDRRPGRLQWQRPADRLRELVVPALVWALVSAPHLLADLQGLFEPCESLGDRREGHAESKMLAFVPGGPSSARPPDSTSRVATVLASNPGCR